MKMATREFLEAEADYEANRAKHKQGECNKLRKVLYAIKSDAKTIEEAKAMAKVALL